MKLKPGKISCLLLFLVLLASCTSTKNTSGTRWYHSFNTRYNVYFNGIEAYKAALKAQNDGYQESYSEMILMYPVSSLPKDKETTGGAFDKSIEKSVKAIKRHSIQTKPQRKAGKSRDPKYREFMSRTEYNPFLHNAWMLMAKSQFHNGDFLPAASSFLYISRLYSSQPEIALDAKIWQARCYAELDWFYEAEDILLKLNNDNLPKSLTNWYSSVYSDLLIKQKQYREAVPYLITSIKAEKDKRQKNRQKYLLGQIYTLLGEKELAYKTFGEVSSSNAPYIIEFSAKIRQTEVYSGTNTLKAIKQLEKMAKSSKNKDYLDQVYYAMGNVYLSIPDTTKAIASYEKGVEKSTQNGKDKALNQIRLGDVYFQLRDYTNAQPNYSGALAFLKKGDEDYPRVSKRSEVLDELVIHHETVLLQDSLQRLSRMSEEERLAVINKIIDDLIKKEEKEARDAARDEYLAQQEEERPQKDNRMEPLGALGAMNNNATDDAFYFYNPQVVALGKTSFQQKWGRRKLEDDWRRKNKTTTVSDSLEESNTDLIGEIEATDKLPDGESSPEEGLLAAELSDDPKDPQYYLQQIPMTEEDLNASNLLIIDALFNMGMIYKDKLEDFALAIETFNTLDSRFPGNENKLESYYQLYLVYWRLENMDMANLYKNKIRSEFPESDYAVAMTDPNYEYNLKMTGVMQEALYQKTYDAYLAGNIREIRNNYKEVCEKYSQSDLMPKFMFLNALSYVQSADSETFKSLMKELIEKYPEADVSILAAEMMKGFQRGLQLASGGGSMLRGSIFNLRFGGESEELIADSNVVFSPEVNTPHELLLVFPASEVDENLFLFTVASFNFGNFMINDFGLEKAGVGEVGILRITGFNNQEEVFQYLKMINQPGVYGYEMRGTLITVPISADNYAILMKGKSLDEYMTFFEENFEEGNETLIANWQIQQNEEEERLSEEVIEEPLPIDSLEQDSLSIISPKVPVVTDSITTTPTEPLPVEEAKKEEEVKKEEEEEAEDVWEDINDGLDKLNDVDERIDEILENPVQGIQNLFKRRKPNAIDEYVKQQEKEEKERQKLLKEEQKQKEKEAKELAKQQEKERKELLKKQQEEEKAILKAKEEQEKALAKQKEQERKQAEDEKKRLAKEKEDARKQAIKDREAERKAKEKQRELERKQKEEAKKEAQKLKEEERKQKEKERKEAQKLKDAERKAKDKQRELERKQKERERKEAQKQKK